VRKAALQPVSRGAAETRRTSFHEATAQSDLRSMRIAGVGRRRARLRKITDERSLRRGLRGQAKRAHSGPTAHLVI